ncbi:MAG: SsrA-binding protein SmpB [bacterium]|nr:SsrA-binding protein SmpB [bacterium]
MAKVVASNRKARHDYEITDTVEAGIILTGQEVKACRAGTINLSGAYVSFLGGKPILKQSTIAKYAHASNLSDYEPGRDRELLLSKRDIERMQSKVSEQGATIVPLEVRAARYIKVVLGLAKGRSRVDKRHSIKDKDIKRRMKKGEEY